MEILKQFIINLKIIGNHLTAQSPSDGLAKVRVPVITQPSGPAWSGQAEFSWPPTFNKKINQFRTAP